MATTHDKQVLAETLKKSNKTVSFTWMDWTNQKQGELRDFKDALTPDWDSNSEKVFKKRQEETEKMIKLANELIKWKFPEDKHASWQIGYDITVLISEKE